MEKCSTCNNEYSCSTYNYCPNAFQSLLQNGSCVFNCQSGYHIDSQTCGSCSDPNCLQCTNLGTQCGLCNTGYYLDLSTYTCVSSCPTLSLPITSTINQDYPGQSINFCRPYNQTVMNYTYFVNPNSSSYFALGTYEHPFINIDDPVKEVFNYMYSNQTNVTIFLHRGYSVSLYYVEAPLLFLNVQNVTITDYGDDLLIQKPLIYLRSNPYQWPDSILFSIADEDYNPVMRLLRGDISITEVEYKYQNIGLIETSLLILNVDLQSIMISEASSNPLIYIATSFHSSIKFDNCTFDLSGDILESTYVQTIHVTNSIINITSFQAGIVATSYYNCVQNNDETSQTWVRFDNNIFFGFYERVGNHFITFNMGDDITFKNNTLVNFSWFNQDGDCFMAINESPYCDLPNKTMNIIIEENNFINLTQGNFIFFVNFMSSYIGPKAFSLQNNYFYNCLCKFHLIPQLFFIVSVPMFQFQILQAFSVTIGNNILEQVQIENGNSLVLFSGASTNVTIQNDFISASILDDLYIISAVKNINITNITVENITNTGTITFSSALINILDASSSILIFNCSTFDSVFSYGRNILVSQAKSFTLENSFYSGNTLVHYNFIELKLIQSATIENITYTYFQKISDSARFVLSFTSLTLIQVYSSFLINNIKFMNSSTSFLNIAQVQYDPSNDSSNYLFNIEDCQIINNSLKNSEPLIHFGSIAYIHFHSVFDNVTILNNTLSMGTIYLLNQNTEMFSIINSQISHNKGQFAYLDPSFNDITNPQMFFIDNSAFYQNFGKPDAIIELTTNSFMKVTNSTFIENYSLGSGSIAFLNYQSASALFQSCAFMRNYAYKGGVFYVQYSGILQVSNSIISSNFAIIGGVAYINNDGSIKITQQSQVFLNSALNTCFLFLINTQYASEMTNITIYSNDQAHSFINKSNFLSLTSQQQFLSLTYIQGMQKIQSQVQNAVSKGIDSSVYLINANVNFTNSVIYDNDQFMAAGSQSVVGINNTIITNLTLTGILIQLVQSTIELTQVSISNVVYTLPSTSLANYFKIQIRYKSKFIGSSLSLQNITGLLLYVSQSQFFLQNNSLIHNCSNDDGSIAMIGFESSQISLSDSNMHNLYSSIASPIVYMTFNQCSLKNVEIYSFNQALFSITGGDYLFDTLTVYKSQVVSSTNLDSIILSVFEANLTLNNSFIRDVHSSSSSPVLYIDNNPQSTIPQSLIISNTTFTNNSALQYGGAIQIVNTNLTITNSTFYNNSASLDGGALYLSCDDLAIFPCYYNITSSNFTKNTAVYNGGAIKYDFYRPLFTGTNTFLNNKASYGSDIGSYPVLSSYIVQNSRSLDVSQLSSLYLSNAIVYQISENVVSGEQLNQSISFHIQDEKGNTITTDSSSEITISSYVDLMTEAEVQVIGTKTVTASNGIVTFNDIIIIGVPGTTALLQFSPSFITNDKISKAFPALGTIQDFYINSNLRLCIAGEYQSEDNKCLTCSDGSYTLVGDSNVCLECPDNAVCSNGNIITVNQGYWRKSLNSTVIYECYNSDACPSNSNLSCSLGYGGNLCQSCITVSNTSYIQNGDNTCVQCLDKTENTLRLIGASLLVILYLIILMYVSIKHAGLAKNSIAYMRILTNYIQILTLTASYELSWGNNVKSFLQTVSVVGRSSSILFSFDCFMKDQNILINPTYVKMIVACLFLVGVNVIVSIGWVLKGRCNKHTKVQRNVFISVIVITYFFLPTIGFVTLAIYSCPDIFSDGNKYLALDMNIQCWTGDQRFYAVYFGLPTIGVWLIGVPVITFIKIFRQRKFLIDDLFLQHYGFLYVGLKDNAYYWELLLHFRKLLIIIVNVFLTTHPSLYRAIVGFILMLVYLEVLHRVQPYKSSAMNTMERRSSIATFITFFGGLFFVESDLPISIQIIIFVVIIIINAVFWFTFLTMMFSSSYSNLRYYVFKRCCRRNKKKRSQKYQLKQLDENDIDNIHDFSQVKETSRPQQNDESESSSLRSYSHSSRKMNSKVKKGIMQKNMFDEIPEEKEEESRYQTSKYTQKDQSNTILGVHNVLFKQSQQALSQFAQIYESVGDQSYSATNIDDQSVNKRMESRQRKDQSSIGDNVSATKKNQDPDNRKKAKKLKGKKVSNMLSSNKGSSEVVEKTLSSGQQHNSQSSAQANQRLSFEQIASMLSHDFERNENSIENKEIGQPRLSVDQKAKKKTNNFVTHPKSSVSSETINKKKSTQQVVLKLAENKEYRSSIERIQSKQKQNAIKSSSNDDDSEEHDDNGSSQNSISNSEPSITQRSSVPINKQLRAQTPVEQFNLDNQRTGKPAKVAPVPELKALSQLHIKDQKQIQVIQSQNKKQQFDSDNDQDSDEQWTD